MAYKKGPNGKTYRRKVNYYSSPRVRDPTTGMLTGTGGEDSARVLRENRWSISWETIYWLMNLRFAIADRGDESDRCQQTGPACKDMASRATCKKYVDYCTKWNAMKEYCKSSCNLC
jgi:hypothetical protein